MKFYTKSIFIFLLMAAFILGALSVRPIPEHVTYGVSFSKLHAEELGLDWKETYRAILDDLGVRHLRLSLHWSDVEKKRDQFSFEDFDYQINEAEKRGAEIVLALGYRLPGWPECHPPEWFNALPNDEKRAELMQYIETVVNRYKTRPPSVIKYWQIENEAFLTSYVKHLCGNFLDESLLQEEIELVHKLDPERKIVLTDSGELGLWYKAYRNADIFATSMYLYVWNHLLGPIRYPMTPAFFRIKTNLMSLIYGPKEVFLSELSAEPWLLAPIKDTPIDIQLKRMNIEKFNKTIEFARKSGFEKQYLWGAEWWYWLTKNDRPEFWERARELFKS